MAFLALAPIREYIIGGSNAGQFPPAGGWEKWLDKITAQQEGDRIYYRACGPTGASGSDAKPVDLFCAGGDVVGKNPAQAFHSLYRPPSVVMSRLKRWWE